MVNKSARCVVRVRVRRCRGRTVKTLESRPVQVVFCLLMVFDAAVVIAEILLDLQAMRSQCRRRRRHTTVTQLPSG